VGCDLTGAVFPAALVTGAEFVACHGLAAETIRLLRDRGATVQPASAASLPIGAPSRGSR
jgi:hypothetical protein